MKKFLKITAAILAIIIIFSPVIIIGSMIFGLPSQHRASYVGQLNNKVSRLYSIEEEKVVVIGGSSVAFALDSELMERELGMPVVNFGLYAALGTKLMLDLSRSAIGEGDVVVISPELDPQTMSLYFSAEQTLRALDDDYRMFFDIATDDKLSLLGGAWRFATDKLEIIRTGRVIDPPGVYNAGNLDERGDLTYPTPENVMPDYYDSNKIITLGEDMIDGEFIDYLNEYIDYCKRLGATVLFAYCPMNELAIESPYSDEEKNAAARREFHEYLSSVISCEIIGSIEEAIMDAAYFYDSNFHLNDAGRRTRTIGLTEDILSALNIDSSVNEDLPEKPPLPRAEG